VRINVCLDTSSISQGAEETIPAMKAAIAAKNLNAEVGITGSWGFCWMEPTATVRTAAGTRTVLYANVTADRVEEFLQKVVVEGRDMPELALGVVEGNATPEIALLSEHEFMKGQIRRVMANTGKIDPENIDHYIAHEGMRASARHSKWTPKQSSRRCWTAALVAARRWIPGWTQVGLPAQRDNVAALPGVQRRRRRPGRLGEPRLDGGRSASHRRRHAHCRPGCQRRRGYIYIRYEYPLAFARMQKAVEQARAKGLLGADILGTGKSFDIVVFLGAGSYVCGEETGLINSIDGYRGMPRIKPPFPAQAGLWNKPTNVNNVESYANAPMIMRNGAAWWSS